MYPGSLLLPEAQDYAIHFLPTHTIRENLLTQKPEPFFLEPKSIATDPKTIERGEKAIKTPGLWWGAAVWGLF